MIVVYLETIQNSSLMNRDLNGMVKIPVEPFELGVPCLGGLGSVSNLPTLACSRHFARCHDDHISMPVRMTNLHFNGVEHGTRLIMPRRSEH